MPSRFPGRPRHVLFATALFALGLIGTAASSSSTVVVNSTCDSTGERSARSCASDGTALAWAGRAAPLPALPVPGYPAHHSFEGDPPGLAAEASVASPLHACEPLVALPNGHTGAVIVEEGNCSLSSKVDHAVGAGATAVIIVSNAENPSAAMDCTTTSKWTLPVTVWGSPRFLQMPVLAQTRLAST